MKGNPDKVKYVTSTDFTKSPITIISAAVRKNEALTILRYGKPLACVAPFSWMQEEEKTPDGKN
jgi:hypothetical protein